MACNLSRCICIVFVLLYILAQLSDLFCQDSSTDELCITIIVIFIILVVVMAVLGMFQLIAKCVRRCRNRQRNNQAYQVPLLIDDIDYQPNQINQSEQYYHPSSSESSAQNLAGYRETYNQNQCTVCLEQFVEGEKLSRLACGHKFHVGCIGDWADRHRSCPVCRINI